MVAYPLVAWLNRVIMEDLEIKYGEPLPPATRMELPELSYEQELLNTPVPFENRIAFLSEYSKVSSKQSTFDELLVNLGVSAYVLRSVLSEINAPFKSLDSGEVIYESHTEEVAADELSWQKKFNALNDYLAAISIAKVLSKGTDSVHQLAYGLQVYPEFKDIGKRRSFIYPKELAQMLHILTLHHPPAGDWYGPDEAESSVGKNREWIESQVSKYGLKSGMRMSRNNIMVAHYPFETIEALWAMVEQLPPPAGDWMTVNHMARLLNKSSYWVNARIDTYYHLAEERLTDIQRVELHYPPYVFPYLEGLAAELPPPGNGWLTVEDIMEMLLKSRDWVITRLKKINAVSEMRLSSTNEPRAHYHPDIVDILQLKYLIDEENNKAV